MLNKLNTLLLGLTVVSAALFAGAERTNVSATATIGDVVTSIALDNASIPFGNLVNNQRGQAQNSITIDIVKGNVLGENSFDVLIFTKNSDNSDPANDQDFGLKLNGEESYMPFKVWTPNFGKFAGLPQDTNPPSEGVDYFFEGALLNNDTDKGDSFDNGEIFEEATVDADLNGDGDKQDNWRADTNGSPLNNFSQTLNGTDALRGPISEEGAWNFIFHEGQKDAVGDDVPKRELILDVIAPTISIPTHYAIDTGAAAAGDYNTTVIIDVIFN